MPVYKILVDEYECAKCGYKWTNRKNGKYLPKPKNCSKCKCLSWEEGPIDPKERSLRQKLIKLEGDIIPNSSRTRGRHKRRPNELCRKFLEMKPRPTISELENVIRFGPLSSLNKDGFFDRYNKGNFDNIFDGYNKEVYGPPQSKRTYYKNRGWSEEIIYDGFSQAKHLKFVRKGRHELMQQIIDSRERKNKSS